MPTYKRLHVATTGTKQSMSGQVVALTSRDVAELASSYAPHLHQCKVAVDDIATAIQLGAPAVLGHLDPRLVEAKGAMPAFGRVLSAEASDGDLYLDLELTDRLAEWIDQGMYDHVSVSWYEANDKRNPTPGQKHLRHVGWLGAEPSAMKDLELPDSSLIEFSESFALGTQATLAEVYQVPVQVEQTLTTETEFTEGSTSMTTDKGTSARGAEVKQPDETDLEAEAVLDAEESPVEDTEMAEQDDELAPEADSATGTVDPVLMLVSVLQDGDKGYKGEISEFRPEPTEDNTFLWSEDESQFAGQFVDLSGNDEEVYDFSLKLQPDGSMIRSYKRVFATDSDEAEPVDDATIEAEADEAEFGEGCGGDTTSKPKAAEMGECDSTMLMADPLAAEAEVEVSMSQLAYQSLLDKAALADSLMAERAEMERAARQARVADMLQPLYDNGLLDPYCPVDSVANAICSMSDAYSEGFELEFSEGQVATSPLDVICAVFQQIGAKAVLNSEFNVEFGEMTIDEPEKEMSEPTNTPKGMAADPEMAKLDKKARQYCKDNGLDCGNNKDYLKALKAVASAK